MTDDAPQAQTPTPTTEPGQFDVQRLIELGRVTAVAPSPCGQWAAVCVERLDRSEGATYVADLWRVTFDGETPPVRLTRGKTRDTAPCFRRDGALGFLSNRPIGEDAGEDGDDGEERTQVWLIPAAGGEPMPLTDEPLGVGAFTFAADGNRLALLSNLLPDVSLAEQRKTASDRKKHGPSALRYDRMPVRYWDHWLPAAAPHLVVFDEHGQERVDLTPEANREHREATFDLSVDGRRVAITRARKGADRVDDWALLVIDIETGQREVLGEAPRTTLETPRFSPDGRHLAAVHHRRSEERMGKIGLRLFDLETGSERALAEDWPHWPRLEDWTAEGDGLWVTADEGARCPVFRVDLETDRVDRLTPPEVGGSHGGVRRIPGGRGLVGIRSTLLHPPEPFVIEHLDGLEPVGGHEPVGQQVPVAPESAPGSRSVPRVLADLSGFGERVEGDVAAVEELHVESTDGRLIQTFLLKPLHRDGQDHALPVVMWIHGGPMGAWADGWHWRWNPLLAVAQGYAIALPNPRGSTGFGQDFVEDIWGNVWGEQCYRDVTAVTDAVAARPEIDSERIGAMGGSFGGYMTNWLGANTDRYRCLIAHAGLNSMSAFYGATDLPAYWALAMGSYPDEDPVAFDRYSPGRRLDGWRTPTLIIHGDRDYRVPIGEALALFEGLERRDVDVELLVFPDENHWILKPRNIVAWYEAVIEYLGRYLGADDDGEHTSGG